MNSMRLWYRRQAWVTKLLGYYNSSMRWHCIRVTWGVKDGHSHATLAHPRAPTNKDLLSWCAGALVVAGLHHGLRLVRQRHGGGPTHRPLQLLLDLPHRTCDSLPSLLLVCPRNASCLRVASSRPSSMLHVRVQTAVKHSLAPAAVHDMCHRRLRRRRRMICP